MTGIALSASFRAFGDDAPVMIIKGIRMSNAQDKSRQISLFAVQSDRQHVSMTKIEKELGQIKVVHRPQSQSITSS